MRRITAMNHSIKLVLISLLSFYAVGCGSPFTAEEATPDVFAVTPEADAVTEATSTDSGKTEPKEAAAVQEASAIPESDGSIPPPTGCAKNTDAIVTLTKPGTVHLGSTASFVCIAYYGSVSSWSVTNNQGWDIDLTGKLNIGGVSSTSIVITPSASETVYPSASPGPDGYIYWNWYPDTDSTGTSPNAYMDLN
jgi:hypothetical protein